MLESFMEDLLWRFPDDFFPGRGFKAVARQFTLSGAGRLDISFRDHLQRIWVIEVKAVPIRTDVADQVYRYAQSLHDANPHDPPIPAVVAPVINATVRSHFDRWGIEHFEISEATFRRVATERGVKMESTEPATAAAEAMTEGVRRGANALSSQTTHLPAGLGPRDGWYQLVQVGRCKFETAKKCFCANDATWHYRVSGQTVHDIHKGLTKDRTDYEYRRAPVPPPGAWSVCRTCQKAAPVG